MLRQVIGKKIISHEKEWLDQQRQHFSELAIDLGTGDAKFAYDYAKAHPHTLVIAIDADAASMQAMSAKAARKPIKGGINNVICIWAAAESLPLELNQVAEKIFINFPWGSLLAGVAKPTEQIMKNISALAKPEAELEINFTYHAIYEPTVVAELSLPELTEAHVQQLAKKYLGFGWKLINAARLTPTEVDNLSPTWGKKITSQRQREVWQMRFNKINQ